MQPLPLLAVRENPRREAE
jgi:hypothetical protein